MGRHERKIPRSGTAIDLTIISEDMIEKSTRLVSDIHIGATNHKTIFTTIEVNIPTTQTIYINKTKLLKDINQMQKRNGQNIKNISKTIQKLIKQNKHIQQKKPKTWWNRHRKSMARKK